MKKDMESNKLLKYNAAFSRIEKIQKERAEFIFKQYGVVDADADQTQRID
jgi:hypothetical protein